jgi:hypothetical protein
MRIFQQVRVRFYSRLVKVSRSKRTGGERPETPSRQARRLGIEDDVSAAGRPCPRGGNSSQIFGASASVVSQLLR